MSNFDSTWGLYQWFPEPINTPLNEPLKSYIMDDFALLVQITAQY
ncbi:hypothetical protein [Nostoc sp.]